MVHDEKQVAAPRRRWFIPVAAAASVALIGAIIWGAANSGGSQRITPAAAPATKTSAAAAAALNGAGSGTTKMVSLPAYFVGSSARTGNRFGLYREFVRTAIPVGATSAQKSRAAVAVAMNAKPFTRYEPYLQPWSGTSVKNLTATPSRITITLSGPGAPGFTAAQTKLAVQQLVWTAQAAIGKGAIPVKFVVASGSTKLFGTYSTTPTYNRPAKEMQFQVLAPIWITSPERAQVFAAGTPVVVKGESCAFEAATAWQLKKAGALVKSGVTTASSGCPERGTWQVNLGGMAAGSYTFRMYETSMESGQGVVAETSKSFTVK